LCESPLKREPRGGPPAAARGAPLPPPLPPHLATPAGARAAAAAEAAVALAWQVALAGGAEGAGADDGGAGGGVGGVAGAGGGGGAPGAPWLRGFGAAPGADCVFPDLLRANGAPAGGGALSTGYGTAHHRYFLNGRLVAVAVVDVLPGALSSVYVFYDASPRARALELGTLTALREVQWVQAAAAAAPTAALRAYLMGFFIESCAKMRYKAGFGPARVCCPQTRAAWAPAAAAAAALRAAPRAPLLPPAAAAAWADGARAREATLGGALARTPLRVGGALAAAADLRARAPTALAQVLPALKELLRWAGPQVAGRAVVKL